MTSCSAFPSAPALPIKIVPYVPPRAPKAKAKAKSKSQPISTAKTVEPNLSEARPSDVDGTWFRLEDFTTPNANASRFHNPKDSALSGNADASIFPDQDVIDSLDADRFQEVPEQCRPSWDLLEEGGIDYATSIAKTIWPTTRNNESSRQELSLPFEGDITEETRAIAPTKPRNVAANANGVRAISEEIYLGSPLAQDEFFLGDVGATNQSSATRKRTYPSLVNTAIVSPASILDVSTDPQLEDNRSVKRVRLIERPVEDVMLDPLPTPESTRSPTHNGLGSCLTVSDDPDIGPLESSSQRGVTGSPLPSLSKVYQENNNDGACTQGIAEELLYSTRHCITSPLIVEAKECGRSSHSKVGESRGDEWADELSSRPSANPTQEGQRGDRSARKKGRRLSQKPRIHSADRFHSTPVSCPYVRVSGETNRQDGFIADMTCQITDTTHSDVPEGSSIVTAIVHCHESSLGIDTAALYHKVFGAEGKGLRMTQLSPDSWILVGYRCDTGTHGVSIQKCLTPLNKNRMSPHEDTDQSDDDDSHQEDGDEDNYRPLAASNNQKYRRESMQCHQQTHKPWAKSDELRLLSYRDKMGMVWERIFECFPDRTPGAVRTRYHMVRGR